MFSYTLYGVISTLFDAMDLRASFGGARLRAGDREPGGGFESSIWVIIS